MLISTVPSENLEVFLFCSGKTVEMLALIMLHTPPPSKCVRMFRNPPEKAAPGQIWSPGSGAVPSTAADAAENSADGAVAVGNQKKRLRWDDESGMYIPSVSGVLFTRKCQRLLGTYF